MKFIKGLLLVSLSLFLLGSAVFLISFGASGWDAEAISAVEKETRTYEIEGNISRFDFDLSSANLSFKESEDGTFKVVCNQSNKTRFYVNDDGGTLEIEEVCEWYNRIFNWAQYSVTVYLPAGEYGSLDIECASSDISLCAGLSFSTLDIECTSGDIEIFCSVRGETEIEVTSGNVKLSEVTVSGSCVVDSNSGDVLISKSSFDRLYIESTSGDTLLSSVRGDKLTVICTSGETTLKDVILTDRLYIDATSGDVELEGCDAASIEIETTSGDVEGTILTPKTFDARATSGDVRVPYPSSGSPCKIRTTSGDIDILIADAR